MSTGSIGKMTRCNPKDVARTIKVQNQNRKKVDCLIFFSFLDFLLLFDFDFADCKVSIIVSTFLSMVLSMVGFMASMRNNVSGQPNFFFFFLVPTGNMRGFKKSPIAVLVYSFGQHKCQPCFILLVFEVII